MTRYNRILSVVLAGLLCLGTQAQTNGSNSSYSRFGLGTLNDQAQGFNKGMAGVGIGIRMGNRVNMANPASYSAIDSLSFILDVGFGLSTGHMKGPNSSVNVNNCTFDYVNTGFRLAKGLGMSVGFVPMTTIGYSFETESKVTSDFTSTQTITSHTAYGGSGGLHQLYIGVGWKPFAELSIGTNISYLWGDYSHSLSQRFEEGGSSVSTYSGLNLEHQANINTYKIDFGAQYPVRLSRQDWLTVGATVGLGHNVKNDATLLRYTTVGDSLERKCENAFDLPYTYGVGLTWRHQDKLTVALDAKQEQWAACRTPKAIQTSGSDLQYVVRKGEYMNRTKIALGAQYIPNPDIRNRNYMQHINYRMGVHYSTPHVKINGQDGPQEYGITAGVGLPITNGYNNRSIVNVNLQWLHRSPKSAALISEDYFMVNIGITFNEPWFMKFKIE